MKNERLLDLIGKVDDTLILRAEDCKQHKNKAHGTTFWFKAASIAAIIIISFALLYQIPVVKASLLQIFEIVNQISGNYDQTKLDDYKVPVNQSVTLDGLTMNVKEVVLQENSLLILCNFQYEDESRKDEDVMPRDWPFCVSLSHNGEVFTKEEDPDNILTSPYGENDIIYSVHFNKSSNPAELIGKEVNLKIYYNHGIDTDKGYDFTFTPNHVYREQDLTLDEKYEVEGYGSFSINGASAEALYMNLHMNNHLSGKENEYFSFQMKDDDGKVYHQQCECENGDYWFTRPEKLKHEYTIEVIRTICDEDGVGTDQIIASYPLKMEFQN